MRMTKKRLQEIKTHSGSSYTPELLAEIERLEALVQRLRTNKESYMFGPPKDVQGECNARMVIGDDSGDYDCTFRCVLSANHGGQHFEFVKGKARLYWSAEECETLKRA